MEPLDCRFPAKYKIFIIVSTKFGVGGGYYLAIGNQNGCYKIDDSSAWVIIEQTGEWCLKRNGF